MEKEKKSSVEKDDLSLPKSVEVDQIIEFYKDIDESKIYEESDIEADEYVAQKKHKSFFKKKKNEDDGIESEVYGLSEKGRLYLYRSISAVISVGIIISAFVLAYFLPENKQIIEDQKSSLRAEEGYKKIKKQHTALKTEVSDLEKSNKEKKESVDKLSDPENTKAELRTEISEKKQERSELHEQEEAKKNELEALNTAISEKIPPETILPPGKHTVGTHIAAGKYTITGAGKFMLASSDGKSKVNTTLGTEPLEVDLKESDILKFDSKVKFVLVN